MASDGEKMEKKQIYILESGGAGKIPCRCIFHDEETGSLVLDLNHRTFHCFGCGVDGKILGLKATLEMKP